VIDAECHTKDSLTKGVTALAYPTQSARWPWVMMTAIQFVLFEPNDGVAGNADVKVAADTLLTLISSQLNGLKEDYRWTQDTIRRAVSMTASVCFRSGVYFHHGLAGSPPMNRTAAMNTSITQGSCRSPVVLHKASYISYGSFPNSSWGDWTPISRKSFAMAGPTLGICCKSVMSALLTVFMFTFPDCSR
jgi:hypothetical protein